MNRMKKALTALFAGVTLAAATAGPLVSAQETAKLGANYELTGGAASYGTPMSNATKLAVKQANEAGGVLDGVQLELVEYDNKSDLTETNSVATRLVEEGVVGVVGPATTGDVLSQAPVINNAGVPAIAPAATGDALSIDNNGNLMEYLFRVCFEDAFQGRAAAAHIADNMGIKNVALVVDVGLDYSQGVADAFTEEFESRGGSVVTTESFTSGDTDFSAILSTLAAQEFDALYVPAYYTEVGLFIKQAREMGITQPIIGADGLHSQTLVDLAGAENASDIYYTTHYSNESEDEKVVAFQEAYEAEYGQEPDTFAALAYDATNLMIDAINRAGSTERDAIRQAIAETKDFEGVTGSFTMGEDNTPIKSAIMLKLTNGEVESAEAIAVE